MQELVGKGIGGSPLVKMNWVEKHKRHLCPPPIYNVPIFVIIRCKTIYFHNRKLPGKMYVGKDYLSVLY